MSLSSAPNQLNDRRILLASLAVLVSSLLPVFLAGTLTVQIAAGLARGYETVAAGATLALTIGGLSSPVAGRLTDRFGWKPVARMAVLISTSSLLLVAASANSPSGFIAAVGFSGIGLALAQPSTTIALLDRSDSQNRGAVLGMKAAASPAATLIAGLAVPLVALVIDWPWAFAGAVMSPLLAAVALGRARPLERPHASRASDSAKTRIRQRALRIPGDESNLSIRLPIRLSSGGAIAAISIGALATFTTVTVVAAGYSEAVAGFVVVGASLLNIFARIANGIFLDRPPRHAAAALTLTVTLLMMGATGFILMGVGERGFVIVGVAMAFVGAWSWNGVFQYSVVTAFRDSPGRASGIIEFGLNLGFASGPLLFLAISKRTGLIGAWYVMAVLAAVAALQIRGVARRLRAAGLGEV